MWWLALALLGIQDPAPDDPVAKAAFVFSHSDTSIQETLFEAIRARLVGDGDVEVQTLLALEERARAELELRPAAPLAFHDPAVYAPQPFRRGQAQRAFAPESAAERYQRYLLVPPFRTAVAYDYGENRGTELRPELPLGEQLENLLAGASPRVDLIQAWLQSRWDFAKDLDPLARHFAFAYCDLAGSCDPGVDLYAAFSSMQEVDMPDVDVIAYAKKVLRSNRYRSPIPANKSRAALYQQIREGFLRYYQHRTWIEAAATLYLVPDAPLLERHEGLRPRLLHAFAKLDGDVAKIATELTKAGERDAWVEASDEVWNADPNAAAGLAEAWRKRRQALAKRLREHACAVLRESGLLREGR